MGISAADPAAAFCCPVCDRREYEPVMARHGGKTFHAGIFRCTNCGFGFVNPGQFTTSLREARDVAPAD